MRENQTVFPHRRVGFPDADPALEPITTKASRFFRGGAPIPGMGFPEKFSSQRWVALERGLGDGRNKSGLPAPLGATQVNPCLTR